MFSDSIGVLNNTIRSFGNNQAELIKATLNCIYVDTLPSRQREIKWLIKKLKGSK